MSNSKTIIFFTNSAWTLYKFRISMMLAIQERGFEVIACAPKDQYAKWFLKHDIRFIDVPMRLYSKNPIRELGVLIRIAQIYRREKPDLVHHFSIKSIIYGSLAAHMVRVPAIINAVTGLGKVFSQRSFLQAVVKILLQIALKHPARITFQNPSDRDFFLNNRLVEQEQTSLILGSGIDVKKYAPNRKALKHNSGITFLMYGRMMWEKGVREYVSAAKEFKNRDKNRVRFILLGGAGKGNPTDVAEEWIANSATVPGEWLEEQNELGYVDWYPHDDNVLPYIRQADVVVLPSYYPEGLPRSALESMACGKAIITTDTPGCRNAVEDGVNGLLVKPRDIEGLVNAMDFMINHTKEMRKMGKSSRKIVCDYFSDSIVIEKTLEIYQKSGLL